MDYIKRHMESVVERLADEFPAVMVTGARQTGKTTLLKKYIAGAAIPDITFDDLSEEESAHNDPRAFLHLHKAPYMFDEIQYVPELFRFLKMTIDNDRRNGMFFLTGNQPFNLMKSASESLAGRIGILQLYSLSQREKDEIDFNRPFVPDDEYISFRNNNDSKESKDVWTDIFTGGFPEVVSGRVKAGDFYESYLKTYIERDILKLSQIENELQFLQFIRATAARTGNLVNYSDLAHDVGISEITAKKWLSLLVTSGLVYLLQPYSENVEKRIIKTPKLYFMDTGLAVHLTRWNSAETLRSGAMAGSIFETYVVSEVIKSFSNAGMEAPLYFYRDKDKKEIDLIICRDQCIFPVEIRKTSTPRRDDAANFSVLNRIKGVSAAPPVIICDCPSPVSVKEGVLALPVRYI